MDILLITCADELCSLRCFIRVQNGKLVGNDPNWEA